MCLGRCCGSENQGTLEEGHRIVREGQKTLRQGQSTLRQGQTTLLEGLLEVVVTTCEIMAPVCVEEEGVSQDVMLKFPCEQSMLYMKLQCL